MQREPIPLADPGAQMRLCEESVRSAFDRVLTSGRYILGNEVEAFEREWAAYLHVSHCIGVGNGTDALALALLAVGVKAGEEVITVSHTAVATVAAIEQIGAVPVFADIEPRSRCMNPAHLAGLISENTRAIVPVHMYGQPAPMGKIMAVAKTHGLKVVEDCAQAHGATLGGQHVGTFGDAAAFSFYPTKNLGALGDAGAIVTNDSTLADSVRMLREYGWRERYVSLTPGRNSRLDELQAAILRAKLPDLDRHNIRRRVIAAAYTQALRNTALVAPPRSRERNMRCISMSWNVPTGRRLSASSTRQGLRPVAITHSPYTSSRPTPEKFAAVGRCLSLTHSIDIWFPCPVSQSCGTTTSYTSRRRSSGGAATVGPNKGT